MMTYDTDLTIQGLLFYFSSAVDIFVSRALPFSGKAGYQGCVSLLL